ncbi:MAG: hypothetical protein U9Q12_03340 [Patescibacteria group bacterium]|nr:hypothetical protein [Patescibacteria group bacterium]
MSREISEIGSFEMRHTMMQWAQVLSGFNKESLKSVKFTDKWIEILSVNKEVLGKDVKEDAASNKVQKDVFTWADTFGHRPPVDGECKCSERWEILSVVFSSEGTDLRYGCPSCKKEQGAIIWSAEGMPGSIVTFTSRKFLDDPLKVYDPDAVTIRIR